MAFAPLLIAARRYGAQMSQRDRAMLRVFEYFAKSLKVTQCHFEMTLFSRACVSPY